MVKERNKRKIHKNTISEILRLTPENEGILYKVDFKKGSYSKEKKNKRKFQLLSNN